MVKPEEDDKQTLIVLSDLAGLKTIHHTDNHRSFMRLVDVGWAESREIEHGTVYTLTSEGKRQARLIREQRKLR